MIYDLSGGWYALVKVKVDQDLCIGCGLCESLCPEVFRLSAEGKSEVVNPDGCDGFMAIQVYSRIF
jgi:ferredoxin